MAIVGCLILFIQGISVSSMLFGSEIHEKTYPLIALLPRQKHRVAYSKLLGASISMLPALTCAILGIAIIMATEPANVSANMLLLAAHAIPQCILFYYLVVYFSFKIRFGSFVVAAFVLGTIQVFLGIPMGLLLAITNALTHSIQGGLFAELVAVLINGAFAILTCGSIVFFLHRLIGIELERASGT